MLIGRMMKKLFILENRIQHYAWGSPTSIPELLGIRNKEGRPFAELWMGAHPRAPSMALTDSLEVPLNVLIARDPGFFLGDRVRRSFGDRLPFLFKVLAAEQPLSLQAHPDIDRAREGYAGEEKRGIPLDSPDRNYRDPNHKPEMICALTGFDALCGFRNLGEILELLAPIESAALLTEGLESGNPYKQLLSRMLFLPETEKKQVLSEVLARAEHSESPPDRWAAHLAEFFSNDIGILAPYIFNLVHLQPGQALALKAGMLHSYLHGTGIELMANSDNVLRGGLTEKHVDRDELLRVLDFVPLEPNIIDPDPGRGDIAEYPSGAKEFVLSSLRLEGRGEVRIPGTPGPEIILCTEGRLVIRSEDETLMIVKGRSVFVAAETGAYTIKGVGRAFKASVPGDD